jgi:hypothetical protein
VERSSRYRHNVFVARLFCFMFLLFFRNCTDPRVKFGPRVLYGYRKAKMAWSFGV